MCLQLVAEKKGANIPKKGDLMDYWPPLAHVGIELTLKANIKRLNAARATLKHNGVLPDDAEVEGFRSTTTNFIDNICSEIFGTTLREVTRAHLIGAYDVRNFIESAENAVVRSDNKEALEACKKAFHAILLSRSEIFQRIGIRAYVFPIELRRRPEFKEIINALDAVDVTLIVVALGLDFEGYSLLQRYTPIVHVMNKNRMQVEWLRKRPTGNSDIVIRCIDFVTDMGIKFDQMSAAHAAEE